MSTTNYSIYTIPFYYFMAILPHSYAISLVRGANSGKWDNSNPRSTNLHSSIQKSVPAVTFGRYERAEACHKNCELNFAPFAAAVILGNVAKLPATTLNITAASFLALRVAYIFAYINIGDPKRSFVRTAIYAASNVVLGYLVVLAGNALA